MSIEERKKLLADYLGVDADELSESEYDENVIETEDGEEYLVVDEDEAREYAKQDIENFIEEMGIGGFTEDFQDWIIDNALDIDWFDGAMRESNEGYVYDIEGEDDDEFENRLVAELYERGLIDDDDLEENEDGKRALKDSVDLEDKKEEYIEDLGNDYNSGYGWFRDSFGDDELREVVEQNNLVDVDKIAEEAIDWDGVAHFIARYDGEEIELEDDMYAYRVN